MPAKCGMYDFRYGKWVSGASECGLTTHHGSSAPTPWADYCWKPQYCDALPFNVDDFCEVVSGKTLLFVGDSLLHNMYYALFRIIDDDAIVPSKFQY